MPPATTPAPRPATTPTTRLAEVTGALTLGIDLAFGQESEHVMRTCLLAMRIGRRSGLSHEELRELYWIAQLRFVGCTGHAHEVSRTFGDEIAARSASITLDEGSPQAVFAWMREHAGSGAGGVHAAARVARALAGGRRAAAEHFRAGCQVGRMLTGRLGLDEVSRALDFAFERWDGKGFPDGARGEAIPLTMRVVRLAQELEVFAREGGPDVAAAMARRRAGHSYDPALAAIVSEDPAGIFGGLDGPSLWQELLDAEQLPHVVLDAPGLDSTLLVVADFVDLKSPYTPGHSRAVATLVQDAAPILGITGEQAVALRRAALVHDLGRVGVPNSVWDFPGPLRDPQWERVRLHAYHTERILARTALAGLGRLASHHHEQPGGGGYHRGLDGAHLGPAERLLAAADSYQALTQPRAWRPARSATQAASLVRELARERRLDPAVVEAVVEAAGGRASGVPRRRAGNPADLTDREVDVVRLLARGLTNKQIAAQLTISPKTVGHHVERAFAKTGISTRGAVALWCIEKGLLTP